MRDATLLEIQMVSSAIFVEELPIAHEVTAEKALLAEPSRAGESVDTFAPAISLYLRPAVTAMLP